MFKAVVLACQLEQILVYVWLKILGIQRNFSDALKKTPLSAYVAGSGVQSAHNLWEEPDQGSPGILVRLIRR